MTRTTVFLNNRSQAVRLPKDVAFPEGVKEVVIIREGAKRIIVPAGSVWDDFFAEAGASSLPNRDQPSMQQRDDL